MQIRVKGYLTFRDLIGDQPARPIDAETSTLYGLIQQLAGELGEPFSQAALDPQTGGVRRELAILVNGRHYNHLPDGLETALKDGDQVAIFPPVAGG
jgi:MoaD family protein